MQLAVAHDPLDEVGGGNAVDVFDPVRIGRAELLEVAAQDDAALIVGNAQARLLKHNRCVRPQCGGALAEDQGTIAVVPLGAMVVVQ